MEAEPKRFEIGRGVSVYVAHGHDVEDRGSIFRASIAFPIPSQFAATAAVRLLVSDPHHVGADHNMSAYRFVPAPAMTTGNGSNGVPSRPSPSVSPPEKRQRRAAARAPPITRAFDDDGEANGGKRLLGMLNKERALGVAVVVSRWFGGVMLGKARFEHIMGAGRSLLHACGHKRDTVLRYDAWACAGSGQRLGGNQLAGDRASAPRSGAKRSRLLSLLDGSGDGGDSSTACVASAPVCAGGSTAGRGNNTDGVARPHANCEVGVHKPSPSQSQSLSKSRDRSRSPNPSQGPGPGPSQSQSRQHMVQCSAENDRGPWSCPMCTLHNNGASSHCAMCGAERPTPSGICIRTVSGSSTSSSSNPEANNARAFANSDAEIIDLT
eukprot:g2367.t1